MRYVWVGIGPHQDGEGTWVNPLKVVHVKPRKPGPGCMVVLDGGDRWTSDLTTEAMTIELARCSSTGVVLEDVDDFAYLTIQRVLWETLVKDR